MAVSERILTLIRVDMVSRKKLKARYDRKVRSVFREHRFLLSVLSNGCYKTGMNAHCGQKKEEAKKISAALSGDSKKWKAYGKVVPLVFK